MAVGTSSVKLWTHSPRASRVCPCGKNRDVCNEQKCRTHTSSGGCHPAITRALVAIFDAWRADATWLSHSCGVQCVHYFCMSAAWRTLLFSARMTPDDLSAIFRWTPKFVHPEGEMGERLMSAQGAHTETADTANSLWPNDLHCKGPVKLAAVLCMSGPLGSD